MGVVVCGNIGLIYRPNKIRVRELFFDNVGKEILEACLDCLTYNAHIILCGSISECTRKEKFGFIGGERGRFNQIIGNYCTRI